MVNVSKFVHQQEYGKGMKTLFGTTLIGVRPHLQIKPWPSPFLDQKCSPVHHNRQNNGQLFIGNPAFLFTSVIFQKEIFFKLTQLPGKWLKRYRDFSATDQQCDVQLFFCRKTPVMKKNSQRLTRTKQDMYYFALDYSRISQLSTQLTSVENFAHHHSACVYLLFCFVVVVVVLWQEK